MSIEAIIDACLSADGTKRAWGEQALTAASAQPVLLVGGLVGVIGRDAEESRRALAAVLLRKSLGEPGFATLPPPTLAELKVSLLRMLGTEPVASVRRKVCHVIATVASAGGGFTSWPELLPAVFTIAHDANPSAREMALFLFRTLVVDAGPAALLPHAAQLKGLLSTLLSDPVPRVAIEALQGATAMITTIEDDAARAPYLELMPHILAALGRSLAPEGGDEGAARDALQALITVANQQPVFIRDFLQPAASAMLTIINHDSFEDETRVLGLEFLLELAEQAGSTVRRFPELVQHVLTLSTKFIVDEEENAEWVKEDNCEESFIGDGNEEDTTELKKAGVRAIDRLANAIGGAVMLPVLQSTLAPMLVSPDWRMRRAALMAMALALEGCKRALKPNTRSLVQQFLPFLRDPHPRVRYLALRFFQQMATDFNDSEEEEDSNHELAASLLSKGKGGGAAARAAKAASARIPGLVEAAGDLLVPALIEAIGPANVPRVRGVAAEALAALLDRDAVDDSSIVSTHAQSAMNALFALLQSLPAGFSVSQGTALGAIGAVAEVLGDDFRPFFPTLMPSLKALIAACTGPEARFARNRALDCLSIVCEAVGREVAGVDAAECLNALLSAQRQGFADDDSESADFVVRALIRLADCLGADFVPYLPFVVGMYSEAAAKKMDITITQDDESGVYNVVADSSALAEKVSAATLLTSLVESLGREVAGIWPYVDGIATILASQADVHVPQVRAQAILGISYSLQAALADTTDPTHAQRMLDLALPVLASRLAKEHDLEVLYLVAEALEEALKWTWATCKADHTGITGADPACVDRRTATAKATLANPDADDEDAAKLSEKLHNEDEFLSHLVDSLGYCIKQHGQSVLAPLSTLAPILLGWIERRQQWDQVLRSSALCLGIDLIEHASPASHSVLDSVMPHLLECVTNANPSLRQPAAYSMGVLAEHGGEKFAPHIPAAVRMLVAVASAPGAREDSAAFATDNAVSSLVKLARYRPLNVDVEALMTSALAFMPFKADGMEACLVHGWLIEGIASMAPQWVGPTGARLTAAVSCLARAIIAHHANVETNKNAAAAEDEEEGDDDEEPLFEDAAIAALPRVGAAVKTGPHAAAFAAACGSLPKKERAALAAYGFPCA